MIKYTIYSECDIARTVYDSGFSDIYDWDNALLITKYIRHMFKFGDAATKSHLVRFLEQHNSDFIYESSRRRINRLVAMSKREFRDTGTVNITQSEVNYIRGIKNFKYQKIALIVLLISKREINKGYFNRKEWFLIRRLFSREATNKDIQGMFTLLYQMGGVEYSLYTGSHKILFITPESPSIFSVTTEREAQSLTDKYQRSCGGVLAFCRTCDAEFIKNGRNHYYCLEHSKSAQKEKTRQRVKKHFA